MVARSEKRWLVCFAAIVLAITTLPYLIGYFTQGTSWLFSGFVFGVQDGNSYIAKMLSGANGAWLFKTPYTAYPQVGFLSFLPYLLLGKLTTPPAQHEQLVALFQIFRWVAGLFFIVSSYYFVSIFVEDLKLRRLATAVICLGGGLGWIFALGGQFLWKANLPLEFYSPETFGFLSLFGLPHLAMARALMLLGLRRFLLNTDFSVRSVIKSGWPWLAIGFFQPLTAVTGLSLIAVYLLLAGLLVLAKKGVHFNFDLADWKKSFMNALIAVGFSAPLVVYTFIAFLVDPFLKGWAQQNIILSPPPGDYLLAFGELLPFALVGVYVAFKQSDIKPFFLLAWVLAFPVMAYAPYNLQRRLPDGIWVSIVCLAMMGYVILKPGWRRVAIIAFASSFLTTLLLFSGSINAVLSPSSQLFIASDEVAAFRVLPTTASSKSVVLASFDTSNALPAWANVETLTGHGPESINFRVINPEVEQFFMDTTSDQDRLDLIHTFNIGFVIWGPNEKALGQWNPNYDNFLTKIYENAEYSVFKVTP